MLLSKGKSKCKILKEIRQKIADENDIPYITSECTYKGDCLGTCPKCEQELEYLERQLERRRKFGKKVVVSGLALSVATIASGCDVFNPIIDKNATTGIVPAYSETDLNTNTKNDPVSSLFELEGDVVYVEPDEENDTVCENDSDCNSSSGDCSSENCSSENSL